MAPALPEGYAEFYPLIAEKMFRVEETFTSWLGSDVDVLSRAGQHLALTGGKRLRPALMLLCSGAVGYTGEHDVLFGAVFEFIHTATLVHDDVIDAADVRRGRPSLNRLWGNELSVLVGDHLYLKAMKMALVADNLRIIDLLADTTLKMIEGELIQTHTNGRLDVTEEEYLGIVDCKTARLFSTCCQVPAMLAGRPANEERALAAYGLGLGMAFQLVDDLLDLTADERVLGKPVGDDIRQGKLTLPLIRLLARGRPHDRQRVEQVVSDGSFRTVSRSEITSALEETGILDESRRAARSWADRALDAVSALPQSQYRAALERVPGFVLSRNR